MFGGEDDVAELLGDVDVLEPRMGNGAAHKSDVARAGHADIADILSPATQEPIVLLARDRGSDSVFCHWSLSTKTSHGIVRPFSGRYNIQARRGHAICMIVHPRAAPEETRYGTPSTFLP